MFVDPAVVRRKVERELHDYVELIDHYRERGIWLLEYRFPELLFAFTAPGVRPAPIVAFGVLMDLSNYDVQPPSIRFVNPFTRKPLKASEIPTILPRQRADGGVDKILQAYPPDDENPFVCLRGVREYHQNPAHTSDPWLRHRASGAGKFARLVDLLARYGTQPLTIGIGVQAQIQMQPPFPT